ncbi:hypothetical protein DFS33DRAFT_1277640 [Desarmillaria ectypa]|nr:hypothetical protein DFS33DRAFT_1277640 [Desarmillaria ectypa]
MGWSALVSSSLGIKWLAHAESRLSNQLELSTPRHANSLSGPALYYVRRSDKREFCCLKSRMAGKILHLFIDINCSSSKCPFSETLLSLSKTGTAILWVKTVKYVAAGVRHFGEVMQNVWLLLGIAHAKANKILPEWEYELVYVFSVVLIRTSNLFKDAHLGDYRLFAETRSKRCHKYDICGDLYNIIPPQSDIDHSTKKKELSALAYLTTIIAEITNPFSALKWPSVKRSHFMLSKTHQPLQCMTWNNRWDATNNILWAGTVKVLSTLSSEFTISNVRVEVDADASVVPLHIGACLAAGMYGVTKKAANLVKASY